MACIFPWRVAIIGVDTKEKIINTYPPLFFRLTAMTRWAWIFFMGPVTYCRIFDLLVTNRIIDQ